MPMSRITRGAAALLTLALNLTGCGRDDDDPTVTAAADLQRALEMDGALDLLGPGGAAVLQGGDKGLPAGLACDASPSVVTETVCGHDFAAEAHYAWQDCSVDAPGDRPDPVSGGQLDLVRAVVGEPDCDGLVSLAESAEFSVSVALPMGRRAEMQGTLTAASERDLEAGDFTRTATIAATRTLFADDEPVLTIALAGELTVDVAFADDGPVRTIDGALTLSSGDDGDATLTLEGVVHRPLSGCAWPTAGTLVRARTGEEAHTLVFGPDCGEASRDGEPVDLDAQQFNGHRRRGRPF